MPERKSLAYLLLEELGFGPDFEFDIEIDLTQEELNAQLTDVIMS